MEGTDSTLIVTGFPKSGCTWLTRLAAETVGCPVEGYFQAGEGHWEIAREGAGRRSRFRCFKSHEPPSVLREKTSGVARLLYVCRDPRDVLASSLGFFDPASTRAGRNEQLLQPLPRLFGIKRFSSARWRRLLFRAVVTGSEDGVFAMPLSWSAHADDALECGVPLVRYEDLLDRPEAEMARLMDRLRIEVSSVRIAAAVENQSFERRRKEFLEKGDAERARFLRKGRAGSWRSDLPARTARRVERRLGGTMRRLGYL